MPWQVVLALVAIFALSLAALKLIERRAEALGEASFDTPSERQRADLAREFARDAGRAQGASETAALPALDVEDPPPPTDAGTGEASPQRDPD